MGCGKVEIVNVDSVFKKFSVKRSENWDSRAQYGIQGGFVLCLFLK